MIKVYQAAEFANNEKPYKLVATIDTESFQYAYRKTQNIDEAWSDEGYRSTSEGDVLVHDDVTYFLVPMGNGRNGNKSYENWGDTEVIDNFDSNGFLYNGNHKIYSKDGSLMATFENPVTEKV